VPGGALQEPAGLFGCPHHDRGRAWGADVGLDDVDAFAARAFAERGQVLAVGGLPGADAFVGPHQRFGPGRGWELNDCGGVEVDQAFLSHRDVQRVP
jgi:hypothetical protein